VHLAQGPKSFKMSKETKFGYGFLLAGVGLPYLTEKFFGQSTATIAAAVCLFLGICLLIAGHLHERRGLTVKVISALVALVLVGGGIGWRLMWSDHKHGKEMNAVKAEPQPHLPGPNPEPTTAQRDFIIKLQNKYEDSLVTVRSIQIDDEGKSLAYVDDTGFFLNDKGLILTTAENLRLPKENCRRKFEVVSSDGTIRETHELGSTTSVYWRLLKIDTISKPLPLSHEPFLPGQILIILGKSAHSGAIESRMGKIERDEDPFSLSTETPIGFNGSPIFNERGKVVAVQIFSHRIGQHEPLMCLKVPTKNFLEGMEKHREQTKLQ
jgi:hypothetical protein